MKSGEWIFYKDPDGKGLCPDCGGALWWRGDESNALAHQEVCLARRRDPAADRYEEKA